MARIKVGIIIKATDNTSNVFKKVASSASKMANRAKAAFKGFGAAMLVINQTIQVMKAAFQLLVAPIIRAMKAGVEASRAFGNAIREVSTLVDSSQLSNEALSATVNKLSAEFGRSPVEQTKAMYMAISAGAEAGAESTALLTAANKLAIGGVTQVNTAVDALTSVMNAYGTSFANSERVSDKFFATIKLGKTTAGQLGASIGQVVSTSANASISMDEMFSVIAAGTKVGQSTAMATVGLNTAINAMLKPTKEAQEEAKRLGIEFSAAAARQKGFVGTLRDIKKNAKTNDETLSKLFGSVRALRIATGVMTNNFKEYDKILPQVTNSAGASNEAFGKMTATIEHQMKQVEALGQQSKIALGDMVTDSKPFQIAVGETKRILEDLIRYMQSTRGAAAAKSFFDGMAAGGMMFVQTLKVIVDTLDLVIGGPKFRALSKSLGRVFSGLARTQHDLVSSGKVTTEALIKNLLDNARTIQTINLSIEAEVKRVKTLSEADQLAILASGHVLKMKELALFHQASMRAGRQTLRERGITEEKELELVKAMAGGEQELADTARENERKKKEKSDTDKKKADKHISEQRRQALLKAAKAEMNIAIHKSKDLRMLEMSGLSAEEVIQLNRIRIIDAAAKKEQSIVKKGVDDAIKERKRHETAAAKAHSKRTKAALQSSEITAKGKREIEGDNDKRRKEARAKEEQEYKDTWTAMANLAASTGQAVYNLGRGFAADLMDASVSGEEAVRNLASSTLTYLAETLAQWTLTEGIKRAILWATVGQKEAADAAQTLSGVTSDGLQTASTAGALTLTSGMKAKETVGSIGMDAAKGQAGALASFASLGPLGIVLGLSAAAVLAGVIYSLMSSVKPETFARGGLVTGGVPGRDSVSALLMPGEFVLDKGTVDAIRNGTPPASSGRYASGGMVTAASSGGSAPIVFQPIIQTVALPNSVQNQRYYRDTVRRTQQRLNRNGLRG